MYMRGLGAVVALLCTTIGSQGFNVRSQVQLSRLDTSASSLASELDPRQQADYGSLIQVPKGEKVSFYAIGDWGRQGEWNQSDVASAMAAAAAKKPLDFILSMGDNFYPHGLTSDDDVNFDRSFTNVYHHKELQVPWYAVLGNHDYGDGIQPEDLPPKCATGAPAWQCSAGPLTQLSARLVERDSRWQVKRSRVVSLAGGAVDIFMYDTTPFVQYYGNRSWVTNPGGLLQQSWEANLAELEASLASSRAGWKIVVGHHPVRSNGEGHGDTPELCRWVEPLLERYGVQLYLAGHDHDLEHIKDPKSHVHHVVSGAGSQTRPLEGKTHALFQHPLPGFVAIEVHRHHLELNFMGTNTAASPKPLYAAVIDGAKGQSLMNSAITNRLAAV